MRWIVKLSGLILAGASAAAAPAQTAPPATEQFPRQVPAPSQPDAVRVSDEPLAPSPPAPLPRGEKGEQAHGSTIPLGPPGHKSDLTLPAAGRTPRTDRSPQSGGTPSLITVGGSLAGVLGLFLLFAWAARRTARGNNVVLPPEVLEVLGRAPLAGRQQVHLLRCGNKLLLISASPVGVETLTEITDPLEVDRLAGLCRQSRPDSATAAFRNVLQQFGSRRADATIPRSNARDQGPLIDAGILETAVEVGEDRSA